MDPRGFLPDFEEIAGESPALEQVLQQAKSVAPSDATVLILGETGTGKELIARAIHRMSRRRHAVFIKLNCATTPGGVLESELFGHEKGAFTGAVAQIVGRLESANRGTLFLDEIGNLPEESQAKLLRVLQGGEFEKWRSNRTLQVDVRLLASTSTDLTERVVRRQFRADLYYRLSVFPVRVPALRERREDIPLLVRHFAQKFARRLNKKIETIAIESLKALTIREWPGNIGELENLIERSVILSKGPVLEILPAELRGPADQPDTSLDSMWRECIVRALRETGGTINGSGGAAFRLGMKPSTLRSTMLRMGISKKDYQA